MTATTTVPSYCYNCVAGPDLMRVRVEDGVAVRIEPDLSAAAIHPGLGRVCVKAFGLIQKTDNPHRVLTPMRRTNPRKGRDQDPGFVPISWDEALDTIAARLADIRARGLLDEAGLPRLAATFGHGGTPQSYIGTFPAFLAAWGPIDYSFGSGQGVKCVHSEHLYGEFWHRGFTVTADTVHTRYLISCGNNTDVSGGVCAVRRGADARARGMKRIQIEPHLSPTAASAAEWVPIKPKTDAAFLLALVHALLFEAPRARLDLPFLRARTASPYLIGPDGLYLRDPDTGAPLLWDETTARAVAHDTADTRPALEGIFTVPAAITRGPDGEISSWRDVSARTAFTVMAETLHPCTPDWAGAICDIPPATIRRIATEYLDHACVGETITIDGQSLPFRPVAVTLGKTVNNGWGAYECCWARTMLAVLVGGLEVPGGTLGTTVRLNKPHENRLASVTPGEDGFMAAHFNATDRQDWAARPTGRNAHRSLVPIVGNSPWAQALGPTHLAWMFAEDPPAEWPDPPPPELWFAFRTNPAISFWDTARITRAMARMKFIVAFAYTMDETNHMADILLPDATDLESTQLIRIGGTKYVEQHWDHQGFALRAAAVAPRGQARDFTWIATELARRSGLLERYNAALNRGAAGAPLKGEGFDFSLPTDQVHDPETIWNAVCQAATAGLGEPPRDLAWFREHGHCVVPFRRQDWYLTPTMERLGLRYELPYQERLLRVGQELGRRLHEQGIRWWDRQLDEYMPIPQWHDVPARWEAALRAAGADPADYPLWGITTKLMPYTTGNNAGIPLMAEVGANLRGTGAVIVNAATASRLGIVNGDWVEVRSVIGATTGRAAVVQGCRPDTIVIPGQFDHWKTPVAKDLHHASLNTITPISLDLTDATGSGADVVRVSLRRVAAPAGQEAA